MSTETIRLIRDGEKRGEGRGYGGGLRGRLYTYSYTVTTRMTSALRCAAMRAILIFHNCEGQSHKTVSTDHNFWRERRAEADLNQDPSAYQPNPLPLGQTSSPTSIKQECKFIHCPHCVLPHCIHSLPHPLTSGQKRPRWQTALLPHSPTVSLSTSFPSSSTQLHPSLQG